MSWSVVRGLILWMLLLFGLRLITGTLIILLWKCLTLLIFGRMVVGRTTSSNGGFEVAGAGVYVPAPELAFAGAV